MDTSFIWLLVRAAIYIVVFGGVLTYAAIAHESVEVKPRWWLPIVAIVFGGLHVALYWLASPILNLATLGNFSWFIPVITNMIFLAATTAIIKPFKIDGMWAMCWLTALLTLAHGGLWLFVDRL